MKLRAPTSPPDPAHMARIAEALELGYAPLPACFSDSIALCQTLTEVVKDIDKSEHLLLWSKDEHQLRRTDAYRKYLQLASNPVYHRVASFGVVTLADASYLEHGEQYCGIKLQFLPQAIVDDPLVIEDIFTNEGYAALDVVVTNGLMPFVWERYDGPRIPMTYEGDEFWEAFVIWINSEADENLDFGQVAAGLLKVFGDGEFDRRFLKLVKCTQAIHARFRQHG